MYMGVAMEAEERPLKKQRLSHDGGSVATNMVQDIPLDDETSLKDDRTEEIKAARSDPNQNTNDHNSSTKSSDGSEDDLPAPGETAPLAETIDSEGQPMSKNQQKKLRKKLEWESKRDERRVKRKEKTKEKRERKKAEKSQISQDHVLAKGHGFKRSKAVQLPITILIDCAFDDLMRDNERTSLAGQITRSYSDNRNSLLRAHLTLCSFTGKLRERFDNVLSHYTGWKGVRFLDCDFVEAASKAREWMLQPNRAGGELAGSFTRFKTRDTESQKSLEEQGEIVYLTSEADDTLEELKPYSTYIIGGLVDKNREKGICYRRATKRGIRTARLPIGEFMDMQSRKVLATNHVNEIMLKWLECGDWGEAFLKAIPKRKGGTLKDMEGEAEEAEEKAEENGPVADGKTRANGQLGEQECDAPARSD